MSEYMIAIDSSLAGYGIAVGEHDGNVIISKNINNNKGQAEFLVPMMEEAMKEAGIEYKDINKIITTIGPGSFTGIRIGLSTARTLALTLGIKAEGVLTTDVIAASYFENNMSNNLCVLLETRRRDYYYSLFGKEGECKVEVANLSGDDILKKLKNVKEVVAIGDAVPRFIDEYGDVFSEYNDEYSFIDVAAIIRNYKRLNIYDDGPVYLRGADVSFSKKIIRKIENY